MWRGFDQNLFVVIYLPALIREKYVIKVAELKDVSRYITWHDYWYKIVVYMSPKKIFMFSIKFVELIEY